MRNIILNNGFSIPEIGYGTFPQRETLLEIIPIVMRYGYGLVDTSDNYLNEEYIKVPSNVIVATKFSWPLRAFELKQGFEESINKIGKVDIYLLHWPHPYLWKTEWRLMEELYLSGKVKAIGVCNFDIGYMKELLSICRVMPSINQIERHPLFQQRELVKFCLERGIQVMAYSPIARMDKELQDSPVLKHISLKYGKSINQIILRWDIDTGCIPIPASKSEVHIKENMDVFDFKLTLEEIDEINNMDCGKRIRFNPRTRFSASQKKQFLLLKVKRFLSLIFGNRILNNLLIKYI